MKTAFPQGMGGALRAGLITLARRAGRMPRAGLVALALLAGLSAAPALARDDIATDCPPPPVTPTRDEVQAGQARARDRGLLWRVERDGRASWLFASIHLGERDWIYLGPQTKAAMRASDAVLMELDPADPATQQRLHKAAQRKPGFRLDDATADLLADAWRAACTDPRAMAGLHPLIQLITITVLEARRDGLEAAYGQEGAVAGYARLFKLPLVALETPEAQIDALLPPMNDAEARAYVREALARNDSGEELRQTRRLLRAWADGNLADLESYGDWCDCMRDDAERAQMRRLLDDRNGPMADGIAARHAAGDRVFAVVGGLHMVGARGLPALMAARGFKVTRVF
ncbi:TraB/GumN family protein [Derxia gummosa]|uniref:TraB/GumN family protein n=1 Tax=Derxia gummosa DSM 723 TaxID=1121388 RepID=A0A9U5D351_9BURK|nr:TraB/GumN family protein [Derxia gummosa]